MMATDSRSADKALQSTLLPRVPLISPAWCLGGLGGTAGSGRHLHHRGKQGISPGNLRSNYRYDVRMNAAHSCP